MIQLRKIGMSYQCPNCGGSGEDRGDPCSCVDCGTELCCNCAVNQRCDSCDCDFTVESSESEVPG